jgi:hypothetical protein
LETGTTWCQQMCHQIRTKGHTDFAEITQVVPWIDFAWEINQDLNADQVANPRLFKSHARLTALHEGCKYLATIRDPVTTLLSLYKFFIAKNMPFPEWFLSDTDNFAKCPVWAIDSIWGGNYWQYMADFYLCCNQPNVLVLCFEDMLEDFETTIPLVANFMEVPCDEALVKTVTELSSKKWMLEHEDKFNEQWFYDQQLKYERYDYPPLKPVAKVVAANAAPSSGSGGGQAAKSPGGSGGGQAAKSPTANDYSPSTSGSNTQMLVSTLEWMDEQWKYYVLPRTGCKDYADMRKKLRSRGRS